MPIQLCRRIRRIAPDLTHNMLSRYQLQQQPPTRGDMDARKSSIVAPSLPGNRTCVVVAWQTNLRLGAVLRGFELARDQDF